MTLPEALLAAQQTAHSKRCGRQGSSRAAMHANSFGQHPLSGSMSSIVCDYSCKGSWKCFGFQLQLCFSCELSIQKESTSAMHRLDVIDQALWQDSTCSNAFAAAGSLARTTAQSEAWHTCTDKQSFVYNSTC